MLNKKQNIKDNSEWIEAFEKCTSEVTQERIEQITAEAIARIKHISDQHKNICSGWIAGKDSIVLEHILKKSGIRYTPVIWRGINEYPAMIDWINRNKPDNLIEEVIDKFSLDFIEKNPDYLFCQGDTRNKWMGEKWKRYKKDIPKHGFDAFLVGRRIKDGNVCGKKEEGFRRVKDGYSEYAPLAEWTHEELLAYIKYNGIELPPFYEWDRGFLLGSVAMGEWTERPTAGKSVFEVWDELYNIDKSIVIKAAEKLTSAKQYLEKRNKT